MKQELRENAPHRGCKPLMNATSYHLYHAHPYFQVLTEIIPQLPDRLKTVIFALKLKPN